MLVVALLSVDLVESVGQVFVDLVVNCTQEEKINNTVNDQLNGDQINGFDQINGQKGYDDHLYVVNNGFLTNYLTDLTFAASNAEKIEFFLNFLGFFWSFECFP